MSGSAGSEVGRLGLHLDGGLEVEELIPKRVDVPKRAKAVIVDGTHIRDPEVQLVQLSKSLSKRGRAIKEDVEVLLQKKQLSVRAAFLMTFAEGLKHFVTSGKMVDEREVSAGDSFLNEALQGDVICAPDPMCFGMEGLVRTPKRAVEVWKEALAFRKKLSAGAPFAPVGCVEV